MELSALRKNTSSNGHRRSQRSQGLAKPTIDGHRVHKKGELRSLSLTSQDDISHLFLLVNFRDEKRLSSQRELSDFSA